MNKFAERLKYLRTEKEIGQEELAKKIGVSKGTISLWENSLREPTLSNIIAIAEYFHVTTDYLTGVTDD